MDDLDAQIEAELARLARDVEKVAVVFVTECLANLIEDTPVDTGWARANWVASSGSPFGAVAAFDAQSSRKTVKGQVGAMRAVQAESATAILSYKLEDGDLYLANNVAYIVGPGSLNDGHSSQASPGFIEAAIARAEATVNALYGGMR